MKNIHTVLFILALIITNNATSQVNSSFNYQGQLYDNGIPANEAYDIIFELVDINGIPFGSTSDHNNIMVENGLFSIDVHFGIDSFDGYEDVAITVKVRKSSTSPNGAYTSLGPNQKIQSVPLATNLTNGDAMSGEVLTFNGFQWNPAPTQSIWTENGPDLNYSTGNVGIGTTNPEAQLQVNSGSGGDAFRVQVNSSTKLIVKENGGTTIGSFNDLPPTNGLFVKGEVNSSVSGDADTTAHLYGRINADGTFDPDKSSSGFSSFKHDTGDYTIDFDSTDTGYDFIVTATPLTGTSIAPRVLMLFPKNNQFLVLIYDLSGNLIDGPFNFIVFKK